MKERKINPENRLKMYQRKSETLENEIKRMEEQIVQKMEQKQILEDRIKKIQSKLNKQEKIRQEIVDMILDFDQTQLSQEGEEAHDDSETI